MKRLIIGSLSALVLSAAVAPIANAKPISINPQLAGNTAGSQTSPFTLANFAYRGYFQEQGIPSYNLLLQKYNSGQISASDIVQAAVEAGRVSSQTVNDQGYLNALELQLEGFDDSNS